MGAAKFKIIFVFFFLPSIASSGLGLYEIATRPAAGYWDRTKEVVRMVLHGSNNQSEEIEFKEKGTWEGGRKKWWYRYTAINQTLGDIVSLTVMIGGSDALKLSKVRATLLATGDYWEFVCFPAVCSLSTKSGEGDPMVQVPVNGTGVDLSRRIFMGDGASYTSLAQNSLFARVHDKRVSATVVEVTTMSDCVLLANLYGSLVYGFKEDVSGLHKCDVQIESAYPTAIDADGWQLYIKYSAIV